MNSDSTTTSPQTLRETQTECVESEKILFISWAPNCSRSDSIAKRLGGSSHMVYRPFWGSRYSTILFKYLSQSIDTIRILFHQRPRAILVMTPPVVTCFPVWLYCRMSRIPYLVDAHTGAFVDERWQSTMFLHRFFSRRAATTIVTNSHLEAIVKSWGAESLIVADVPVCFAEPTKETLEGKFNMVFVSSFTKDEPLELFLQAAARLPQIHFYVTGDIKNADPSLIEGRPANVSFTGFLPDERYVGLLQASDAVICLTTFDHTMQRGAYEAVYLGKPVITSNFGVLREAFNKGAVHVDNTVEDMVRGVQNLLEDLEKYRDEVLRLRDEKLVRWEEVASKLHNLTEG